MIDRRVLRLTSLGWGLALPVFLLSTIGLACIHATDHAGESGAPGGGVSVGGGGGAGEAGVAAGRASGGGILASADPSADERSWVVKLYYAIGPETLKQVAFIVTGIGLMLLVLWPSYQRVGWYAYPIYWAVMLLLGLIVADWAVAHVGLHVPVVRVSRSARRWVGFAGAWIQPSEFMKLALVLALARYLRFRDSYRRLGGLIPPFLLTLAPMVLILFQPDLGTLLMLLPVLFAMLFVAGARLRHLALIVVLGCATLPVFYAYGMKDYQRQRIDVLLKQGTKDEAWHMGDGYQLRQSKIALGTGGVWGTGYGEGLFVQYDGLLPEEQNDFIFAILGHQWGLAGAVLVIAAYGLIVLFGIEVATITNDPFGRLVAVGVIVMIVAQALLNICMTIGLAPITGMPLPFVSAGGSSLWANFLGLGLLVNVAKRRPLLIASPPFEYAE